MAEGRGIDVDARVSLVGELAGETITLDRAAWRVVRAVGPDTTLRQVAAALGASIVETAFALRAMSADGIVIVGGAAPGGAVTGLDAFATTASVTPAAFDPAAFDPATYDPAEHEPVEWSAQAGTHGYADEPAGLGAEALALGADVAALQAAARDLRIREEHEAWAAAQPAEPVEAEFRPDRTSAFARLATERTEAELRAQAEAEEAARAGFALAVDDIDLLPGAHAADATYAEPGAEDAPEFDPDAYAPLSFDAPSFEAPPLTNLAGEPIGQAAYADPAPAYAEPAYVETDFVAEGYTEADYLAPEPGAADPADPGFEEYEAESDADPESPRAGEPKDRGALLRMFSALREG
jgi:hypothetical protein